MLNCINGHEQPDDAKFCGICGSAIESPPENNASDLAEWVESTDEEIELDLMSDDTDDVDDTDDTDDTDDGDDVDNLGLDDSQAPRPFLFGTTVNIDTMQRLQDWAIEYNETDHPYIKGLQQAVANRDDLSMWASLNPQEMLPTPEPIDGSRLLRISRLTSFLRNVLVFVPVLLTWLSIGRAVDAFGKYAEWYKNEKQEDLNLQFLQFWQNPDLYLKEANQSLNHFWLIGSVAVFAAILIFLIIALTFISGALATRGYAENEKAANKISMKRIELGLAISNTLHGKRQANPESIGEALAEALNDLTQAARDVNESASRLETVSSGVAALNPHIETLNENTQAFVTGTGAQISKSVNDLVSSVQNLNSAVGGNVTSLFSEAALSIEEASKQLARTNASVEYGTKQLREDLEAIHQQLQGIVRGSR